MQRHKSVFDFASALPSQLSVASALPHSFASNGMNISGQYRPPSYIVYIPEPTRTLSALPAAGMATRRGFGDAEHTLWPYSLIGCKRAHIVPALAATAWYRCQLSKRSVEDSHNGSSR